MRYWQAINLSPKKQKALVSWFKWVVHYGWEVEWEDPEHYDPRFIFQATEKFVREQLLPEKIQVECGEEKITYLELPVFEEIIEQNIGSEFKITNLTHEEGKDVVGKIAWHLFFKADDSISIQAEDYGDLSQGICVTLFDKDDVKLLEELLVDGYIISYQSFAWTVYP